MIKRTSVQLMGHPKPDGGWTFTRVPTREEELEDRVDRLRDALLSSTSAYHDERRNAGAERHSAEVWTNCDGPICRQARAAFEGVPK